MTTPTPAYTPRAIRLTIQIALADMPEVPTRFGAKGIIAQSAIVEFDLSSGLPEFQRCQLTGSVPLKAGGPSRSPQSDDYWHAEDMPEPIQAVVVYARNLALGMLK